MVEAGMIRNSIEDCKVKQSILLWLSFSFGGIQLSMRRFSSLIINIRKVKEKVNATWKKKKEMTYLPRFDSQVFKKCSLVTNAPKPLAIRVHSLSSGGTCSDW